MRSELKTAEKVAGLDVYRADGCLDGLEACVYTYGSSHPRVGFHWGPFMLVFSPEAAVELTRCFKEALSALDESAREAEEVRRA